MNQPCRDFITHPSPSPSPYHIFFLPGNPGLVEYYARFLSLLHKKLNSPQSSPFPDSTVQFNVAGCSFAGFETGHHDNPNEIDGRHHLEDHHADLYSITEQVNYSLQKLYTYIQNSTKGLASVRSNDRRPKVILIGHSFGTFVAAEMMKQLFSKKQKSNHETNKAFSDNEEQQDGDDDDDVGFDILGSILLFPPIPDLAKSPRGEKIASIARWQYLPSVASYMAKLVYNLPLTWSNALIKHFTAFPSDALHTTRSFFGSENGVAQALYMARLEIDEIKLSRWEAAFQVVASSRHSVKRYVRIFFGKNDYWVRNDLRDAFIYKYCDDAGPKAFDASQEYLDIQARIDPSEDGDEGSVVIPHDFSIRHSEHVVPYVVGYVEEMIKST